MLEAQHSPRGKIYTKESNEPSLIDYVKEINRLGYNEVIDNFKKKCNLDSIKKIFLESDLTEKRKKAIIKLVTERYQELTY